MNTELIDVLKAIKSNCEIIKANKHIIMSMSSHNPNLHLDGLWSASSINDSEFSLRFGLCFNANLYALKYSKMPELPKAYTENIPLSNDTIMEYISNEFIKKEYASIPEVIPHLSAMYPILTYCDERASTRWQNTHRWNFVDFVIETTTKMIESSIEK